mgnify:CR=1 FL=1
MSKQDEETLATYKPKWRPFEIVSLALVLTIPVIINLTIAENPSAWALVGFGAAGAALLFYLGRSRKQEATAKLLSTPDGEWVLIEGRGNPTGHEPRINPNNVTTLTFPPNNDTKPGFLLVATDPDGNQTAKMLLPQNLANASLPLATELAAINQRVNTGTKRTNITAALNVAHAGKSNQ